METYRYEARSVEGFVQQLAVGYLARGYVFYVAGHVAAEKDAALIDEKLLTKYRIRMSKWTRSRARKTGWAAVQYLRFQRFFLLLATTGQHRIFEDELVRDVRKSPIRFAGYSIGIRSGRVCVRIDSIEYRVLKRELLELSRRASAAGVAAVFERIPFEPWRPVRSQLLSLLRAVNRERAARRVDEVSRECVRWRRRIVFEPLYPALAS